MTEELFLLCEDLENDIKKTYEEGVSLDQAEKLAAKFLYAQIKITEALSVQDLDTKMKKSGVKAVRAAIYMSEATKGEKKPSDTFLQSLVDMNEIVGTEQRSLDESEVKRNSLENYFNIFKDAHVYFRQISKGRFE